MTYKGIPNAIQIPKVIKEARLAKGLSQQTVAEQIEVSPEMVGRWERGLAMPRSYHKKDLASLLDIQPEILGIPLEIDYSLDSAWSLIKSVELSLDEGAFMIALGTCTILVENLTRQVDRGEVDLLVPLCRAQYLIGHIISIAQNNPRLALTNFNAMKRLARQSDDKTLLCIALTYQGEMYRRIGDYEKAIRAIQRALRVSDVDDQVKGNAQQLLARCYRDKGNTKSAMDAMDMAAARASGWTKQSSGIYVCFNLCGVYIDYANMYMKMGKIDQSFEYIAKSEKLEKLGYTAQRWSSSIMLTKGEIFINAVVNIKNRTSKSVLSEPDYLNGVALVEKGYLRAKELGHRRQVQQTLNLPQTLIKNEFFVVGHDIAERLFQLDKNREA